MSEATDADDAPGQHGEAEVLQTHIAAPDREFQALVEIPATTDPMESAARQGTRILGLTRGGDGLTPHEDDPFTYYNSDDAQCTVIPDAKRAVGYFLHGVEQHSEALLSGDGDALDPMSETDIIGLLGAGDPDAGTEAADELEDGDTVTELLADHIAWRNQLTERDRRLLLMDMLEWRADEGGDFAAAAYMDEATWRETGLTESARSLAEQIHRNIDARPRLCYHTAGTAIKKYRDNHRVEYVEGIALPHHCSQAIRHAWLEIDGAVAELTWPWHRYDPTEAEYFGVPIDAERVIETRKRRGGGSPVLLSDEQAERVDAAMRGEL